MAKITKRRVRPKLESNAEDWAGHVHKLPQPGKELLWKEGDFKYKKEELLFLPPAHSEVIYRLVMHRNNQERVAGWTQTMSEEELNNLLFLWHPCKGCVPNAELENEYDNDVMSAVKAKFRLPMEVACSMATEYYEYKFGSVVGFQPVPMIEPSYEEDTYYAIVDWDKHLRYVFGYEKAWAFKWYSLTAFSNWILACMLRTVQVYKALGERKDEKLRVIKQDPMYRIYDDEKNPFGSNPNPNE